MMTVPSFWVTNPDHIAQLAAGARKAQVDIPVYSAGGRPVYAFRYGEKQAMPGTANYSSACGAHNKASYVPVENKKPVVILLGAVHGAEIEGTAALVNLIHLLEEGRDLNGDTNTALLEALDGIRLVILPVCNPDGRARFPFESALGMTMEEQRYWFQGTWKDGTLCGWPGCKMIHPIAEASGHLGSYFNDDGVNMMHDNFFHPMAKETQALLDLADEEKADFIIQLHGGSNSCNALLGTSYVTKESALAVRDLSVRCDAAARPAGLRFTYAPVPERENGANPPSFNLASALHHVCGAVSTVFESNQHVEGTPGIKLSHEEVYLSHQILFEQLFRFAKEMPQAQKAAE